MFGAAQCSECESCQQNFEGSKAYSFCEISLHFRPSWWCFYQYSALKKIFGSHMNLTKVYSIRHELHPLYTWLLLRLPLSIVEKKSMFD